MRKFFLTSIAAFVLLNASASATELDVTASVDFTAVDRAVNRALFSLVNYQRFSSEAGDLARAAFRRLNPGGTSARTEIMIDRVEPVNDNADPAVFNWEQLQTDAMYRFIDSDGPAFLDEMLSLGMEPFGLLSYNVEWLGRHGRRTDPPWSNHEWAEFAAAVVEAHNGASGPDYLPQLRAVEIWNEPSPGGPYWTGSRSDYYALFKSVAERIHRDYPGVAVGGPSVLSSDGAFMLEFIEACSDVADFFTMHFYNQDPVRMARRIADWSRYIEAETGKAGALHITESDNWNLTGSQKADYLLTRQFELIARSELIGSFHHFSLPYYEEAPGRVFGLIRPDGDVVPHNYWPYYMFAGYEGDRVEAQVRVGDRVIDPTRDHREALPVYVAASRSSGRLNVTLYVREQQSGQARLEMTLPADGSLRELHVEQLHLAGGQLSEPTTTMRQYVTGQLVAVDIDLTRGQAVRVSLTPTVAD